MAKKDIDITKSGPMTFKDLQTANNSAFTGVSPEFQKFTSDIGAKYAPISLYDARNHAEQLVNSPISSNKTSWGESMFDNTSATEEQFANLGDVRAENQPWYAKLGAGLVKGAALAGTTFLDGTIGLVLGAGTAIKEGRWSGLWDNDFSRAMQQVTDFMEENLPNYYTQDEMDDPWGNIFSANFLGDKFIKNLGFAVGALYSGGVYSGAARAAGKGLLAGAKALNASGKVIRGITEATPLISSVIGATTAAVNEGRIEAINNSRDWFNLQKAQIDDAHAQRLANIELQYKGSDMYDALMQAENDNYFKALEKVTEDRAKMGNADLLMNIPILMASNLIQWGKLYGRGFNTARRAANGRIANNIAGNPGEYVTSLTKGGAYWNAGKMALSEGTEEISQKAASNISGLYYQDDVNNFHKKLIDPEAEQEQLDWTKSFAQGINQTVNDAHAWEEFFIGTLTGALGIPTFRSARTSDGKWQSPIKLQGGIYNEVKEYNENIAREQLLVDYMNNRVKDPKFLNYYRGLTRHRAYQEDMNQAVLDNNEFDFKNAEYNQFVSDIIMFDNAGKLEDLKALIGSSYDISDENLDSIIKNTTSKDSKGNLVGPYAEYATLDGDGNIVSNLANEDSKKKMIKSLTEDRDDMLKTIEDYANAKIQIDSLVGDQLDDEQVKELTWLKIATDNLIGRSSTIHEELKPFVSRAIGYLTESRDFIRREKEAEGTRGTIRDGKRRFDVSEQYEQLSKAEKNIQHNIDALGSLINANPHMVAAQLFADKKDVETIKKLVADTPSITATEAQEFNKKIDDLAKIVELSSEYSKKLTEYLKDPQKKVEDNARADQQVAQNHAERAQSSIAKRINWNGSIASIAEALEENKGDINSAGGMTEFMKALTPEQKKLVNKARKFSGALKKIGNAINDSDLTENQKRIAHSLVDDAAKESEDIKRIGDSIQDKLASEEFYNKLSQELEGYERDHGDWAKERVIASIETKLKEFFDSKIDEVAKAVNKAEADREKLERAKEEKAKRIAESLKEGQDVAEPSVIPEEPNNPDPSEFKGMDNELGQDPSDMSSLRDKNMREYNPKVAAPPRPSGKAGQTYNYRPQITELYLHGYNMETYIGFIKRHPEAIPEGVDPEAYKQYIEEVYSYLLVNGAFSFVNGTDSNWKMEVGDTITFEYNKELSEKAGVPVVTMVVEKQDKRQVVGTLPTSLDFNSRSKYVKTDVEGKPMTDDKGNWIWETSEKTVGEMRPAQMALYDSLVTNFVSDEIVEKDGVVITKFTEHRKSKDGTVKEVTIGGISVPLSFIEEYIATNYAESFNVEDIESIKVSELRIGQGKQGGTILIKEKDQPGYTPYEVVFKKFPRLSIPSTKTKVSQLMGGKIVFSSNQSTVSEVFGEEAPVIAVFNESPALSTGNAVMDAKFINPTNAIPWQVYVMIPANNGKYLPALAVSTPLTQLSDDDWYMQQTVSALQKIPTSLRELKENTSEVFKWLNIPGLSIRVGKPIAGGKFAPETSDIANATHVRITFTNPKEPEGNPRVVTIPIEDGKISTDTALKAVKSIIKRSTLDASEAGLREPTTNVDIKRLTDKPEHREYRKNIAKYLYTNVDSSSPHTRNDWFLYEPTQVEREANRQSDPAGKKGRPQETPVHGGSKEMVVDGKHVEIDKNKVITDLENGEVISMEIIDMGTPQATIPLEGAENLSTSAVMFSSPESSVEFGISESEASLAGRRRRRTRPTRGSDMEITEETSKEDMSDSVRRERELERIKKMFPSLSENGRILVVNGLRRISEYGNATSIYGHFRDGILYINSESPRGTGFHEAFHYVVQTLMTDKESETLFKEAAKIYGDMSEIALEEKLSEDFRHFMNGFDGTTILGKIKSAFKNLKYIIKQVTGNINYLDNLFYSIYKGSYASRKESLEDDFQTNLLKLKNSRVAYEYLSEDIRNSLEKRGITREDYNNLNTEDKERMVFCLF